MKGLTVTEQIYLIAILLLKDEAYGVKIREKIIGLTGKNIVFGTIYNNLEYLVKKDYVNTEKGDAGQERGGNKRVYYTLTDAGINALREAKELQDSLWSQIYGHLLEIKSI